MKHLILVLALFSTGAAFADGDETYEGDVTYTAPGFEENTAEANDDLLSNGIEGVYDNCRRHFGPRRFCEIFVDGVRYSEGVFTDLLRRTGGNRHEACGLHRRHFNQQVEHSFRPAPFKKGYVFFGREITRCGG